MVKDKRWNLNQRSIMFALMLDRSEVVPNVIIPALKEGKTVISDRWGYSTICYQIYAAGLKEELGMTDEIIDWLTYGCLNIKPDMVFYFPDKVGNRKNDPNDRFDNASSSYMQRVIAAYDMLAEKEGWYLAHAGNNAYETLQNLYKSVENKL
jgi:dTMP kinase